MIKISNFIFYKNGIKMYRDIYGENDIPAPPPLVLEPSLKDFSKINKQYKYSPKKFIVKNIQKKIISNTI